MEYISECNTVIRARVPTKIIPCRQPGKAIVACIIRYKAGSELQSLSLTPHRPKLHWYVEAC